MAMCRGGNKAICAAAYGLRVASGSDCLDLYMMGDIEIDDMTRCIIHNNELHDCWTYEQLGHLTRIMETREYLFDYQYNMIQIIKSIEKKVDEYNYFKMISSQPQLASPDMSQSPPLLETSTDNSDNITSSEKTVELEIIHDSHVELPSVDQIVGNVDRQSKGKTPRQSRN
ncbi:Protein-serine/threonine phosphatase [Caenorhabditis elegans]|uniref:Protein-serine/threonine phosphatase n=1 Tax=Caenorhabditis elegans TaxID=6239 RepID=Q9XWT1_CAEEL|nr:Protein-serine/threonine phosphatase [Caenorhabditis elegans]CAA21564.1 Protein-serine/threonine phosphatase [Caenorhabditis elegans]|eukprot:NP_509989.1 Uncharacterized protein CELE_Y62H9A.8 [Caenorhabditis elegans]